MKNVWMFAIQIILKHNFVQLLLIGVSVFGIVQILIVLVETNVEKIVNKKKISLINY
jgi:hypothetical protein